MIEVDTLCHKIPKFVEKAKRAGVTRPDFPPRDLMGLLDALRLAYVPYHVIAAHTVLRLLMWKRAIERDPAARSYNDLAPTPVRDDEDMMLDLLTKTTGTRHAIAHARKVAELTGAA